VGTRCKRAPAGLRNDNYEYKSGSRFKREPINGRKYNQRDARKNNGTSSTAAEPVTNT